MIYFLATYFAVYGGINLYFLHKVRQAVRPQGVVLLLLVIFLLMMVVGPIVARMVDRAGYPQAARPASLAVYVWMAVVMWFFFIAAVIDLWNAAVRLLSAAAPSAGGLAVPPGLTMIVSLVLILAAGSWGLKEASGIRLTGISVKSPLLEPGSDPLRIVQISDIHLGLIVGEKRLARIVDVVRRAGPDMLVSTGDLVDGTATHFNHLADRLAAIDPPLGKYAVTGNHEFYAGLDESLAFHASAGFEVLRGEARRAGTKLVVAGVDDPAWGRMGKEATADEGEILPGKGKDEFTLLLKHRPDVRADSLGRFDLQLSGHTHRGQIYPFNYLVRLVHPRISGYFDLGEGSSLFVSRGAGTWGPPMRLFAPPEVTLVLVEPE